MSLPRFAQRAGIGQPEDLATHCAFTTDSPAGLSHLHLLNICLLQLPRSVLLLPQCAAAAPSVLLLPPGVLLLPPVSAAANQCAAASHRFAAAAPRVLRLSG